MDVIPTSSETSVLEAGGWSA